MTRTKPVSVPRHSTHYFPNALTDLSFALQQSCQPRIFNVAPPPPSDSTTMTPHCYNIHFPPHYNLHSPPRLNANMNHPPSRAIPHAPSASATMLPSLNSHGTHCSLPIFLKNLPHPSPVVKTVFHFFCPKLFLMLTQVIFFELLI